MRFIVTLAAEVTVRDGDGQPPDDAARLLEAHLDEVMVQLDVLNAQDPFIDLDLEAFRVNLSVLTEAENPISAVNTASDLMRTAVHAAHGSTPDWPGSSAEAWSVRLTGLSVQPVDEVVDAPQLTRV